MYIEIWFDCEQSSTWKITVWYIDKKNFDPIHTHYNTISNKQFTHIFDAIAEQKKIAQAFKKVGYRVYMNNYNKDSYFWVRPAWLEKMIVDE